MDADCSRFRHVLNDLCSWKKWNQWKGTMICWITMKTPIRWHWVKVLSRRCSWIDFHSRSIARGVWGWAALRRILSTGAHGGVYRELSQDFLCYCIPGCESRRENTEITVRQWRLNASDSWQTNKYWRRGWSQKTICKGKYTNWVDGKKNGKRSWGGEGWLRGPERMIVDKRNKTELKLSWFFVLCTKKNPLKFNSIFKIQMVIDHKNKKEGNNPKTVESQQSVEEIVILYRHGV